MEAKPRNSKHLVKTPNGNALKFGEWHESVIQAGGSAGLCLKIADRVLTISMLTAIYEVGKFVDPLLADTVEKFSDLVKLPGAKTNIEIATTAAVIVGLAASSILVPYVRAKKANREHQKTQTAKNAPAPTI